MVFQGNFFISFFVLTNALEDPAIIGGKAIEIFNTVLRFTYVGLLITCFILSLGNRPQGYNKGYTLAFIGFAIFAAYMKVRHSKVGRAKYSSVLICYDGRMQFAAVFLTIRGVQEVSADKNRVAKFSDVFTNAISRDIVISISATIGLYVTASIIHVRSCCARLRARWLTLLVLPARGSRRWILGTWPLRSCSTR